MIHPLSSDERRSFLVIAVELVGGDQPVARHLLEMIVATNRATLVLLQDSVNAQCWDNAASAAHRLAGSARMLECDDLAVLIGELETAVRARQVVLASALLPHVASALTQFETSIKLALGASS